MPYKKARLVSFISRYHKTLSVERNKIAYLAGLVDGEGYFKIEKWGLIRLVVGMTDYKTIRWRYTNFGGSFDLDQVLPSGKKFYVWRMNGFEQTFKLVVLMYPFLITKKKIALNALAQLQQRLRETKPFHTLKGLKWRK